jgi:hypothetical protein
VVRSAGIGPRLFGGLVTLGVAAVLWFTVGHKVLDKVGDSSGDRQTAGIQQFKRAVAAVKRKVGPGGRLVAVTLRDSSAEFVTSVDGDAAHALRWTGGDKLVPFDENGNFDNPKPWPIAKLDPAAPKRIFDAVSEREGGRFSLSIGDLQRAQTGTLVWTMRGVVGERGVAYTATPAGRGVRRYDPTSSQLSVATRLTQCLRRAGSDPAQVQRCVARFTP